jgi:hypothetical protein
MIEDQMVAMQGWTNLSRIPVFHLIIEERSQMLVARKRPKHDLWTQRLEIDAKRTLNRSRKSDNYSPIGKPTAAKKNSKSAGLETGPG